MKINVSAKKLKWGMRFYPPLLFQRVWVKHIAEDFSSVKVVIHKSFLNMNYNKTIFGGTIFSAVDPFCTVLLAQSMQAEGVDVIGWLKGATVNYIKPGHGKLHFEITFTKEEIAFVKNVLLTEGKFVKNYNIELYNEDKVLCAMVTNEIYLRNKAKRAEKRV